MYGLVNKAIQDLVSQQFGPDVWRRIVRHAEVPAESFVAMESYDDQITYRLVGAVSAELGMAPEAVLETFGTYWTRYTIEEGYGDLLGMMGSNLGEFLDNLDAMHERLGERMPRMVPPAFERIPQDDGSSILVYESERAGLAPMVIGLLKGLAERFDEAIEIEMLQGDEPEGVTRFHLRSAA